jgi:hypothetical protein
MRRKLSSPSYHSSKLLQFYPASPNSRKCDSAFHFAITMEHTFGEREEAGYDFETDPEAGYPFEILNWQLIRTWFQCVWDTWIVWEPWKRAIRKETDHMKKLPRFEPHRGEWGLREKVKFKGGSYESLLYRYHPKTFVVNFYRHILTSNKVRLWLYPISLMTSTQMNNVFLHQVHYYCWWLSFPGLTYGFSFNRTFHLFFMMSLPGFPILCSTGCIGP